MSYQILPSEMLAAGAIVALGVVGQRRPEIAPATGAVGGALAAWLVPSLMLRESNLADIAAGVMVGAAVGVVQRGE